MIRHVKIAGLWGQYEVDWQLHPDVNIVVGVNGSGKSTLLRIISAALLHKDASLIRLDNLLSPDCALTLDGDGVRVSVENGLYGTCDEVKCGHSLVSTFDDIASEKKALERELSPLAAQLDAVIFDTQRPSLNSYRLKATENPDAGIRISRTLQQWMEVVNTFFAATSKTLEIQGSNVFFRQPGGEELTLSQLSAGEKQLLIILTSALIQDGKPFVLLMDEPEISLDIDWQYRLIAAIRALNPSCQLIAATHSPAVFGDGWNDKLFFMENLLKKM
ncbi:MAG: ATP-binding protein [Prevotellaceae bacterium]|jgi:ABC-type cobalamin/Fe3+-siderophores transport system ATPase subunit|nr:ATP-binding protein [Prevotellaceae bacterium]